MCSWGWLISENWCVDGKGGDEDDDDDDEQTENVTGDFAQGNGNCKMEITAEVMRWSILKETQC